MISTSGREESSALGSVAADSSVSSRRGVKKGPALINGFTGKNSVDWCSSNPCENGAQCSQNGPSITPALMGGLARQGV